MNKNIIYKINALGGNAETNNASENFAENWKNIRFSNHLYHKDWQLYGIDEFYESHKGLYDRDKQKFFENLLGHYFSDHDQAYGQHFYKKILIRRIRPFTAQTMKYISRKLKTGENWKIFWIDS
ncbi:hypothetical protein OWR28_11290 [Chryseobacterium sp. 1B4]